jgi:hypothetical protein
LRRVELALFDGPLLVCPPFLIRFLDCLLDLLANNALQTGLDLSATVLRQSTICFGNVVPEEGDVEKSRDDQAQGSDDPDQEGEQHGEVDDGLLLVSCLNQDLNIHEELHKVGALLGSVVTHG